MPLDKIRGAVSKFAHTISKTLDVDVLIIDDKLKLIGSTFRYFEGQRVIRHLSVVGRVIASGKVLALEDRRKFPQCQDCPESDTCEMRGLIAVPIRYKRTVVGAIALIIPPARVAAIFQDVDNSVEFLQDMAALISSKIHDHDGYTTLDVVKREREILMDEMDYAVVATDHLGNITYFNRHFGEHFCGIIDPIGTPLFQLLSHKSISDFFLHQTSVADELVFLTTENDPFYGFLTCKPTYINGKKTGALFQFKPAQHMGKHGLLPALGHRGGEGTNREPSPFSSAVIAQAQRLAVGEEAVLISHRAYHEDVLMARFIHSYSSRSHSVFSVVDCQATSDLYGDSVFGEVGQLHLAHKGSVLFRRVDCLPYFLQVRLLAFLEEGALVHGDGTKVHLDVRLFFSTTTNLEQQTAQGGFLEPLYHRIAQGSLGIPPIEQEPTHLRTLVDQTLQFYKRSYQKEHINISAEAAKYLYGYDWPGQTTQLNQVIDRLVYEADSTIHLEDLRCACPALFITATAPSKGDLERADMAQRLEVGQSTPEICEALGISRATFYRKRKQYQL